MRFIIILAAVAATLVFAGSTVAANGGNSANAKLCQKGGWKTLMDASAKPFSGSDDCVSYGAEGGLIYALAKLHVQPCAAQPFDGLCVSTEGSGLEPTTIATTPILKNGTPTTSELLIVQADGTASSGQPFAHFEAPCVAGNVWSATASGTSADSLSVPHAPGIPVTSNTVTRTSDCP